jgi:hypothetical protein
VKRILGCGIVLVAALSTALGFSLAADASGSYLNQGQTENLCVNGGSNGTAIYSEHTHISGNCAAGYTQITVAADPDGYEIEPVTAAATADVVTVNDPGTVDGTIGEPFALTLSAASSKGYAITTWQSTSLPAGLSLPSGTGEISGTPDGNAGQFSVTVTVTDSNNVSGQVTFDIDISAAPPSP